MIAGFDMVSIRLVGENELLANRALPPSPWNIELEATVNGQEFQVRRRPNRPAEIHLIPNGACVEITALRLYGAGLKDTRATTTTLSGMIMKELIHGTAAAISGDRDVPLLLHD